MFVRRGQRDDARASDILQREDGQRARLDIGFDRDDRDVILGHARFAQRVGIADVGDDRGVHCVGDILDPVFVVIDGESLGIGVAQFAR